MQTRFYITALAVTLLLLTSCVKTSVKYDKGNMYEQVFLSTKSDSEIQNTDSFSFAVTENDVRIFLAKHASERSIHSLKPVERNGQPLLYIVNYDKGWSVCPADKHLPPIVAENEDGSFDLERLDNPGVIGWMHEMMDAISLIRQETSIETANENTNLWEGKPILKKKTKKDTSNLRNPLYTWTKIPISQVVQGDSVQTFGPYLSTKWGQGFPWNKKLPVYSGITHYYTGCVAVAVSQLLYYYHSTIGMPSGLYHDIVISDWTYHPETIDTTAHYTSTLARDNYTYFSNRWDLMIRDETEYNIFSPLSVLGADYVSDLMVDVGNRVAMRYEADGSGSSSDILHAQASLYYYGLYGSFGSFDIAPVNTNLKQQRPFYMTGYDTAQDNGHAWVVDGLKIYRQVTMTTYMWIMGYMQGEYPDAEPATYEEAWAAALAEGAERPEDGMITHEYSYGSPYKMGYHMNWGLDGILDGFFYNISSLTVGNYHFTSDQHVLYDIHS